MSILIGLFVEFLSIIAVKNNLLIFNNSPPYAIHKKNKGEQWRLFDKEIGPWHKPMSKDRHIRRCFDVNYQSNNIGARDNMDYDKVYFNKSTILLGDSFAEGFGVNLEETFAKIIEKSTKKKIINLGVAGSNTSNNLKRFSSSISLSSIITYFYLS